MGLFLVRNMYEILGQKRKISWEREKAWYKDADVDTDYYLSNLVSKKPKFNEIDANRCLDIHTKIAALKVAPSVVALVSYLGEKETIEGAGTIVESNDGRCIVLTSANIIRRPTTKEFVENNLIDDMKIRVYSRDGSSYDGELVAYDFHFNLAAISFYSESPLPVARLAVLDDCLNVSLPSFELRTHSRSYNLSPGDDVVAVGRYFCKPFELMAAPGAYWLDRCEYDCKELLKATSFITRCGDGGPLVNHSGEVIGIIYYDFDSTPFMPIRIALKWWEHYKTFGKHCRPSLGIEATNFYTADLDIIERVNKLFPSVCNGVLVEKVIEGFSADLAGLRVEDVIVECGGKNVRSFLEFFDIIWDKAGDTVNLVVVRQGNVQPVHLTMLVEDTGPSGINRWPSRT
ncbi:Protease Do-like 14-like protein [Heracleum sosnowskyi]|uniref:Protease Do-like 14-like protein n=1 Tax=Heracleum sosnowskyi TaxID=360622 RepID=A0AAD8H9D9_9APIA|nr:Protease Do-like 14-like protein [Heracleum sosnowskyi]